MTRASAGTPPRRPQPLTTAAVCRLAGVTRGQLRVYEREGLLAAPLRSEKGYRHYPADIATRLAAIRAMKEVGFTLREIALLLDERDHGGLAPDVLRRQAREQVAAIDTRIARLQVVREFVAALADGDFRALDDPACNLLLRFLQAGAPSAVEAA